MHVEGKGRRLIREKFSAFFEGIVNFEANANNTTAYF